MPTISISKKVKLLLFSFILLNCTINAIGQTGTTSLKEIPTDVKQTTNQKVVTKSQNVTNNALDHVDSASSKAFRGFKGLFKRKKRSAKADSVAKSSAPTSCNFPLRRRLQSDVSFQPSFAVHNYYYDASIGKLFFQNKRNGVDQIQCDFSSKPAVALKEFLV